MQLSAHSSQTFAVIQDLGTLSFRSQCDCEAAMVGRKKAQEETDEPNVCRIFPSRAAAVKGF